jgi:hypothetical protein
METGYKLLMSVYSEIEGNRVAGILEMEGIKSLCETESCSNLKNFFVDGSTCVKVYVEQDDFDRAAEVLETEITRGDF